MVVFFLVFDTNERTTSITELRANVCCFFASLLSFWSQHQRQHFQHTCISGGAQSALKKTVFCDCFRFLVELLPWLMETSRRRLVFGDRYARVPILTVVDNIVNASKSPGSLFGAVF
jgi:hypothetical protein